MEPVTPRTLVEAGLYPNEAAALEDAMRYLLRARPELGIALAVQWYTTEDVTLAEVIRATEVTSSMLYRALRERGIPIRPSPTARARAAKEPPDSPPLITYTNRKGVTYTLCRRLRPTGRSYYVFARKPKGTGVHVMPDGYTIRESVNGLVSLVRVQPDELPAADLALVTQAIAQYCEQPHRYRAAIRQQTIEVYENSHPSADLVLNLFTLARRTPSAPLADEVRKNEKRYAQFTAVLRFVPETDAPQTYRVERWCYRGDEETWVDVNLVGPLPVLVAQAIPRLETPRFYDLRWSDS